MRLLIENYGDIKIFKDKSLFGLPRFIVEEIDGYTRIFSGIWYKKEDIITIVEKQLNEQEGRH